MSLSVKKESEVKQLEKCETSTTVPATSSGFTQHTEADTEEASRRPFNRKGLHFALAFTALSVVAFTSALDATILAIALPV
jgi:hypothetical protein